jgi:hypothetical protein
MNRALLSRDVTIGMRTRAFAAVLCVHAALLAAFVVLWDGGVPMLPGANVYQQQRLVQLIVLLCLLPWAAVRCAPFARGDEMVLLSAIVADRPSRIVSAQFGARLALLAVVVLSGLPLMLLSGAVAAQPVGRAVTDVLPALGVAAIAASSSVWWTLGQADRLTAWLGAAASTATAVAAVAMLLPTGAMAGALTLISVAGVAASASRANWSLRYLSERIR